MRAPDRVRAQLRELGEELLILAEILGYLFTFGAMIRYVVTAPDLLYAALAGICMMIMLARRFCRWQDRGR